MKIKTVDIQTKTPLANVRVQLQVQGRDSGFMTVTTDETGTFMLDDRYEGQHISTLQGIPIEASDGATLKVADRAISSKSRERALDDANTPLPGVKKKETWK